MKNKVELPELLTVDELADYLGVGRRFIYRLTHERRIPFSKMGGELRFQATDVARFLSESTTPARPRHIERRGRPRSPYSNPKEI